MRWKRAAPRICRSIRRNAPRRLPRAYQWADGSAYVNHVALVRKARGVGSAGHFWTDPLIYQGGSDIFLGPRDPIPIIDEAWGIDLEAEVVVILGDVPMGATREQAEKAIRLIMLVNDVTLRNLTPGELAKGFGFFQSKPRSAFTPVAVTPDELGHAWDGGKVNLPLLSFINGKPFGKPICRQRHDLRFSGADRACGEDPCARPPAPFSAPARSRTATPMAAPASRLPTAGLAIRAWPNCASSRRSRTASRRRRF